MKRPQRPETTTHIKDLIPDPANRRAHNPRNIGMLVDALGKVGASRSIVVDENDVILAGNGVVEAASEAGLTKVQIVEADGNTIIAVRRRGLTEAQKRDLAIYDNRTAELATWNVDQLAADLKDGLSLEPFFFAEELQEILATDGVKPGRTDPDAVPKVRATDIRRGDMFELGAHRLLCGDSTKGEELSRLMGPGNRAAAVVTDPPFFAPATHYQSRVGWQRSYTDMSPLREFWNATVQAVDLEVIPTAHWFIFCNCDSYPPFYEVMFNQVEKINTLIWDKGHVGLGHIWRHQHELILWGRSQGHYEPDDGLLRSDVLVFPATESSDRDHPVQKPVDLLIALIRSCAAEHSTVLEPFSGSGTTMIAAEQTNRRCCSMELDAQYCQVTIDRWEAFTGLKAQKVGEAIRA